MDSAALVALITAVGSLFGLVVKIALGVITSTSNQFTEYLKGQTERDREEREKMRQTLAEHTDISRTIAHNQTEHTTAITTLMNQVNRIVERLDRMESRRVI